jgi:hypothetical protein
MQLRSLVITVLCIRCSLLLQLLLSLVVLLMTSLATFLGTCSLFSESNRGIDWHWGSGAASGNATEYVSMTWQGRLLANYSEVYSFNVITVSATDSYRFRVEASLVIAHGYRVYGNIWRC